MSKQIKRKIVSTQKPTESVTKPMPQKKRVVAYCRVSSLAEEQALSFESQKNYYEALLGNAPDVILLRVYGDEGISGLRASKRPEFQKMIDECRKGNIDEIYTKSVSRFARNYAECLVYSRELKRLGICIHFEKEAFTTFDENMEMYFHVMAILAQEESNSISQSINWAIAQRRKSGDPIQAAYYGFRRDKSLTEGIHKWHIVEYEALRVRMIFTFYLAGDTMAGIAKKLSEFEKQQGCEKTWSSAMIGSILSNVAYIGDLKCGKFYTADYLSKKCKVNKGERPTYYLKGHHDSIIDKSIFEKAQSIRELRKCRS